MPRQALESSLEEPLDVETCALELLMPGKVVEESLDLVRSTRAVLGDGDRYLGSIAVDFLELEPRFEGMRQDLQPQKINKNKGGQSRKPNKSRSGNPAKRAAAVPGATGPQVSYVGHHYRLEEVIRIARLTTRSYDYQIALGHALVGDTDMLENLESWGDDTMPTDMSEQQQIVASRFEKYMAEAEPFDLHSLVDLYPVQRVGVMRAAWGSGMARIDIAEEYMAAFCLSRLKGVFDRRNVVEAFNRDRLLSQWRIGIDAIPTLSREPADLQRRTTLVRKIGAAVPVVFENRVKPGPTDSKLRDTRRELIVALARYDALADTWEAGDAKMVELFEPHKAALQEAADPFIVELRELPDRHKELAEPWLQMPEDDDRNATVAESAQFLDRLLPDIDRIRATGMISIVTHLRDAALAEDEAVAKEGRMSFLRAIDYEIKLQREYDDAAAVIANHSAEVPKDAVRQSPLWDAVDSVLVHWDDVQDLLTYHTGGEQMRTALRTVRSWLEHAQSLVQSYEAEK
ncbi:MAG TPA: hypothetical protein VK694_06840 [Verrucomicrobiae bacterium]|nr:hypothetical protein [Verrucomicrobiae bacterium]